MKIGIGIVHYGSQEVLDECELSLASANKDIFTYDIFDCNKNNIFFTRANNELIWKFLYEYEYYSSFPESSIPDWVWLLNNDCTVPPETFASIESILPLLPPGIYGFKILVKDNLDLIHHGGTHQAYPNGIHKSGSVRLGHLNETTEEKWVTFASVLIHRDIFVRIGLLDSNMRHICSDSDFCYRARAAGYPVRYVPQFIVHHKVGTASKPTPEMLKIMQQDVRYFENKWINGKLFLDLDKELL